MGQTCSTTTLDNQELEKHARTDGTGKRRLSVITLPPGQQPSMENLPPTVTKVIQRYLDDHGVLMDTFCMSCAGTYAPDAYKENQDDFFVHEQICTGGSLFCVMDGHGVAGRQASTFVNKSLSASLCNTERLAEDPQKVLRAAFNKAQRELQNSRVDCSCSGTTCVVAYMQGRRVLCANAGDSRCIIGYRLKKNVTIEVSHDHKPDNPEEKKRIVQAGGRVEPMRGPMHDFIGPHRVWVGKEMFPGLAMSRSIGDSIAQSVGVTSNPDFDEHEINFEDSPVMILASDGVWEFITSEEAVQLVTQYDNPKSAAIALCQESLKRWAEHEDVCDDITAVVTYFTRQEKPVPAEPQAAGAGQEPDEPPVGGSTAADA
eukprot:c45539_g1_i1.p1 GENE.c45539_g1_i1~~c45539_g1_i1.p1  ORF type:complete len:373 (-),score=65.46 c45539_g1_i1:99-1217(-)